MFKISNRLVVSSALVLILSGTIAPTVANAATASEASANSVIMNSEETNQADVPNIQYISGSVILTALQEKDPEAYARIPKSVRREIQIQDMLRQGTTKVVRTKNGFKIYLNSAIVKAIKYAGVGVSTVVGVVAAAGITASTIGVGSGAFIAAMGVVNNIASSIDASRGVIIKFSKKGQLISWKKQ